MYALQQLENHLKEGACALDVGSGSGYLTVAMAYMVNISSCYQYKPVETFVVCCLFIMISFFFFFLQFETFRKQVKINDKIGCLSRSFVYCPKRP